MLLNRQPPKTFEEYKTKKYNFERAIRDLDFAAILFIFMPVMVSIVMAIRHLDINTFARLSLALTIVPLIGFLMIKFIGDFLSAAPEKYVMGTSFKSGTFLLTHPESSTKNILWSKIYKELNEEEIRTFSAYLPNFKGSIEDLISLSKDLTPITSKV